MNLASVFGDYYLTNPFGELAELVLTGLEFIALYSMLLAGDSENKLLF